MVEMAANPPKQARSVYHLWTIIWGLRCFSHSCFVKVVFVSDRRDHRNREYHQAKAESTNDWICVGAVMLRSGRVPELTVAGEKLEAVREVILICFLLCSGKQDFACSYEQNQSRVVSEKLSSAMYNFLNSDKTWNIWHSEICVNPFLLLFLQYLWTGDPSAVSCQLSSGAVSSESLDEVPGTSSQGLWLLQHAAEETCPSAGDPAVWRAWSSVCCPEEHQLDCAEKVKPQGAVLPGLSKGI